MKPLIDATSVRPPRSPGVVSSSIIAAASSQFSAALGFITVLAVPAG